MRRAATPTHILRTQARTIIGTLPQLRDGQIDAIHDARVASRRIREALPLTREWYAQDVIDDLEDTFRRIGKHLGRVVRIRHSDTWRALARVAVSSRSLPAGTTASNAAVFVTRQRNAPDQREGVHPVLVRP